MTLSAMRRRAPYAFVCVTLSLLLTACGGGGGGGNSDVSYTVTAGAGANGSISPASATVVEGANTRFTITPSGGYDIENVTGCGGTLSGNTYTTGPITDHCTVNVSFTPQPTVSATAGLGGSISPGSTPVSNGTTTSFTVTPNAGYDISSVTGCGGTLSGNTYTTGPVTADCSVVASFYSLSSPFWRVSATAGLGGDISPASATVNEGVTISLTVTPDSRYGIRSITGCGGSLSGNTYTTDPVTADCTVNATFIRQYTLTAGAGAGGDVTPASATINEGDNASFSVTPSAGYGIDSVTGCNGTLSGNTYTTGPVTADCSVNATFIRQYTVTTSAGAGGDITPASTRVNEGANTGFTVTPSEGYGIDSVTGCGGTLSGNIYTTGPVTADCSVNATFIRQYTLTASAGAGGDITPASATINEGDNAGFTLTPNAGYAIDSITGCNGTLSGNTYTTGPVTADCSVNATFIRQYTLTASAGAGGDITPASATINEGDNASFSVTPTAGYGIDSVTGCDGTLSGNIYTTGPAAVDCTVNATFIRQYTLTAGAGAGGDITPASATVNEGDNASFSVTPDAGYDIDSITGCGGTLTGYTYTTGPITADCSVYVAFVMLFVDIADAAMMEDKASLTFTVSLNAPALGDVTVDYATSDGTATTGDGDYTPANGSLTIHGGTISNTVSVTVNGDTTVESDETLTLTLSNVSVNATLSDASAIGTLLNDDATGTLNDTGLTLCGDYAFGTGSGIHNNNVSCTAAGATTTVAGTETGNGYDPVPAGQDALFGRDVTADDDSNGHAGFVFTKIDSAGNPLPADAPNWDCVLDNVTGLLWEKKTAHGGGGLRDSSHTYTWYNVNSATNGGSAGTANGGSCYDTSNCDTEKYVAQVNASGLCGFTDWRLPDQEELQSITDMSTSNPLDEAYFPTNGFSFYWSSSPSASSVNHAWGNIGGSDWGAFKSDANAIRLVRTSQ